jgi:alpha-beta hydrolase superfamily lysophospholipase
MASLLGSAQDLTFTVALTLISRILLARDRILGRVASGSSDSSSGCLITRTAIRNGDSTLDGVLALPLSQPPRGAVLICHGIGEVVEHWLGVQRMLADCGIASLVFDYSGYGRSSGRIGSLQCERDAVAAFRHLQDAVPSLPVSLLGFSLGSGIAAAILSQIPAHRLVLCASFPSFRAACSSAGFPRGLAFLAPPIWNTQEVLRTCAVPALIVHGKADRLFPAQMARDLQAASGPSCELVIVPELGHDDPYYHPERSYWSSIASFLATP